MKRIIQKIAALLLIFSMLSSNVAIVSAAEVATPNVTTILELSDTRIDTYEDTNGNTVLLQYVDGILTLRNTIYVNNTGTIKTERFDTEYSCDYLYVDDYIVQNKTPAIAPYATNASESGTIYYRTLTAYDYYYYNLDCSYYSTYLGPSTYTVNEWVGELATLIAIFVPTLGVGAAVIGPYLAGLLQAMGIVVVQGVINTAFTATLSAVKTQYDWTLADSNVPDETKHTVGYKYVISDSNAKYTNKVYYDGNVPQEWGDASMASRLHGIVYAYTQWEVVRWGSLS